MHKVVLIGDSIRMHMQADVAAELAGYAEVWGPTLNAGTTSNTLRHLEDWALSRPADLIHINVGLHDLARMHENKLEPRNAVSVYKANVRTILSTIRTVRPTVKLYWARTTPVHEARHHATKGFERYEADVDAYNAAADEVTRELGVESNDLFKVVMDAGRDRLLTPDGVHYTPEGQKLLAKAVAGFVRAKLG
jgi:acyl-CoA thioesterase-1